MPFSRDPRKDRRRRVLRETVPTEEGVAASTTTRARARRGATAVDDDALDNQPRRSAGYSQDVRRACQHRLVQLIPVRRRAFLATILVSCLIPSLLLIAHYLVYVSGTLRLYGNPLAVMLDAGHSRGLCAWLCSQLWLLCLGATIFTFRLRRHKLDDYQGEYRLWFWLVTTCIVGSLDSTTGVVEIFGQAMDRWSQLNLGWSGKAVVQATMATLIGILGLRLCSELKNVPTSLLFWLVGLLAWAGSAVLSQELFKIDLSSQFRYWLRSALWIGGMTSIWLAALSYLRNVYIEAQRRFLLRGRLAASVSSTWRERVSSTMPSMPKLSFRRGMNDGEATPKKPHQQDEQKPRRRFALPSLLRRNSVENSTVETKNNKLNPAKQAVSSEGEVSSRNQSTAGPLQRTEAPIATGQGIKQSQAQPTAQAKPIANAPLSARVTVAEKPQEATPSQPKRSLMSRFMRAPKNADEAPEFEKVDRSGVAKSADQRSAAAQKPTTNTEQRKQDKPIAASGEKDGDDQQPAKKRWLPKISLPRPKIPSIPMPRLPKISMPKLKMPSLRLPPPDNGVAGEQNDTSKSDLKPVNPNRPLPSTNSQSTESADDNARPLSKAERKRLKKIQDDQQAQRRAA